MRAKYKIILCVLVLLILSCFQAFAKDFEGKVRDSRRGPGFEKYLSDVTVYEKSNPSNRTKTSVDGYYSLKNVTDTEEFLVFEKSGYETDLKKINQDSNTLDMALVEQGLTTISDKRFFEQYLNLDFEGLEKVKEAINNKDMLLAKYELINYYKLRKTPLWNVKAPNPQTDKPDKSFSTVAVDQELAHTFTYNGLTYNADTFQGSGDINWSIIPTGDSEWMWALNRMFSILHMGKAWGSTYNPKYAYEYMAEYIDWIAENPKPFFKDSKNTWRTIEAGIRNHYPLPDSWYATLYSEEISTQTRITILKSNIEHMEYLSSYMGGGNWLIFESRGLYTLAVLHPEFKNSQVWKDRALNRAFAQYVGQYKEDGWQFEQTPNYHMEATNSISEFEKIAKLNNEKTVLADGLIKAYNVENIYTLPGGRVIPLNDSSLIDIRGVMRNSARLVGDFDKKIGEDYIYTATDYRAGKSPTRNSYFFNYAGSTVMRDFWGPNNITLYFEGGPSGVGGHGKSSRDKLQLILGAFGRDMLIDSGVYSYAGQDIAKYMYTTPAHNAVTIDSQEQIRRENGMDEPAKNVIHYEGNGFDYTNSLYNETFGELTKIEVDHKRSVLFDKSGLIFVNDLLTGEGEHSISQYWNISACKWTLEKSTNKFVGKYDDGTGVVILSLNKDKIQADVAEGQENPFRGWAATSVNIAEKIPNLRYFYDNVATPKSIDTLIIPFEKEEPKIKVNKFLETAKTSGVKISFSNGETMIYLSNNGEISENTYDSFKFDGNVALITKDSKGKIINVKKYPENSKLYENNAIIEDIEIKLPFIKSGDVINTDFIELSAQISGVQSGIVKYYAKFSDKEELIATGKTDEKIKFDLSSIPNQKNIQIWAVLTDDSGIERKSVVYREIELSKFVNVQSKIELENREIIKSENVVVMIDDEASNGVCAVVAKDNFIIANINSDSNANVFIRAKSPSGDSVKINVEVNGELKDIFLNKRYDYYNLGEYQGLIKIKVINTSDSLINIDALKFEGENVIKTNNKVLHHITDITDSKLLLGDNTWENYIISTKNKVQHFYGLKQEGGFGLTARYTGNLAYELYYNNKDSKLQITSILGNTVQVLTAIDFKLDETKWYHLKLKVEGSAIDAKIWGEGEIEPTNWMLSAIIEKSSQGLAGLTTTRCDLVVDDIKVTTVDEKQTLFFDDLEGVFSGNRPQGTNPTKSNAWFGEDKNILKFIKIN